MICLQTDQHFRSSILSEITWPVLRNFFPCIKLWKELICHPGESFVIFINIQFQKWLGFLLMLFQTSYTESVKKLVEHLTIFGNFCCTKSLKFSFIQNRCGKFYSLFGIATKVHLLVSKVW